MAQTAPASQDVQDIQFKLHDRFTIFPEEKDIKNLVSLLAVSSSKGLLFAANGSTKELKVFKLRDVVESKTTGQGIKVRVIKLPGEPKVLACSCDGAMLAVNYILNDTGFLQIYQVESFLTPTLVSLYNLPIAPENKSFALQLLWNPVISNNIALILIDGSVTMFTLSNGGQYDKVSLGKEHHVKSGCWSPKGKQIVFGFADGKLQQFKPNLQPARVILCPAGVHPGPFACIAVHWLSTFQFAVIFLQKGQDMCPSLFIVNAPKVGQPSYINYYDVCYSAPVPRLHQLSFNYIAQWNILLVSSANGVEVGVLGTKETGETPTWIQYTLLDEARIEMPLTDSIDETYPLGFAIDTSSSHQVIIGENKLPVMPMIHVLSTHGHLISYNFLNLSPNAVGICSPPPPLNDISGQFVSLSETLNKSANETEILNKPQAQDFNDGKFMLGSNIVTSTPAVKDKPVALFNLQQAVPNSTITGGLPTTGGLTAQTAAAAPNKSSTGFGFGATASPFSQHFGGMTTVATFGGFAGNTTEQINPTALPQPSKESESINKNPETNKPLYTVPPIFTPPVATQQQPVKTVAKTIKPAVSSNRINLNAVEIDEVVNQMIGLQIEAFDTELRQMRQRSQQLMENIGSPVELKSYTKQLNDIEDIIAEANDHEFEQDVQSLRHSMNESYAMLAECRTKLDLYNNPSLTRLSSISTANPTNRRQLAKLQAYVSSNQNQLAQLNQLIDGQWSQYQDVVRRNSTNQMHIPCLDGIYQRMSKLKDLLAIQRVKMNHIKTKLKQKGLNYRPASDLDVTAVAIGTLTKNQSTIESLADAILSMSMSEVVSQTHAKLSEEKLAAIRNFTKRHQQIAIIKPKRPDRVGIKSEVILETKLETERKQKEMAKKQLQNLQQLQKYQYFYQQNNQQHQQQFIAYKTPAHMQQQLQTLLNKPQQQQNYQTQMQQHVIKPQPTLSINQIQQQPILAKPTASKPSIVTSQPQSFITPTSSTAATLSFGGNSSFVKTAVSTPKSEESGSATPFSGFGMTMGQSKPIINTAAPVGNDNKENKSIATPTPISFSAKVIGGNDAKPFANMSNKTIAPTQGFGPPSSTGFSAFTTTKSMTQPTNQDKDIAKKPEETGKPFNFANATATTAFTGFAPSSKSTTTAAPFSSNIFSSNTAPCTSATTPFAALAASSSAFTFNATVTTSTSAANNSTKAVIPTAATVIVKQNEIKTTAAATSTETPAGINNSSVSSYTNASVTKTSVAYNVPTTASRIQESKSETNTPTSASASVPSAIPAVSPTTTTVTFSSDDPTDSLFGSLNVCKPTAKLAAGDSNKAGNIFSGVSAATSTTSPIGSFSFAAASASESEDTKSFLSTNTTTIASTTASTGFSFVSAAAGNPPSKSKAATETATSVSSTIAAVTTINTTTTTTTASSFSFAMTTPATGAATPDSLFDSLSMSSSTATSTATTTAPASNIFSGGSSMFAAAATVTPTTSLFGGGAAVTSTAPSLFASTAPAATTVSSPTSGSIFAATAAASPQSGGSLFGGTPKPEQSAFSASNTTATQPAVTNLFATAAANTKAVTTTASSIFGGGSSTGFGGSAAGSIFGGGGSSATATSPFTSTAPPSTGGSIFNSPTQQPAASGGSLFGGSTFNATAVQQQQQQQPQSPGSIFGVGGGNAQSPTTGVFGGSGGSIFGGTAVTNASVSGGSLFSGSAATATSGFGTTTSSTGFGSFSQQSTGPAFGSPTAGSGFGAPASTTSFGSPQQQSAFAKPLFGGPPSFGSPQPAFGAQPTFGGAATFGGFGSFASTSPTGGTGFGATAQGAEAPKGNIFETLGSQDSGLSFGNLAHSTQAPQQPKPSFGGSSFMNYRS